MEQLQWKAQSVSLTGPRLRAWSSERHVWRRTVARRQPYVEGLTLPKSIEINNPSLNKAVIRRMSD
jgi:hypothetical protein